MIRPDDRDRLSTAADALRHPVRITILELLATGTHTCGALTDKLPLAQATVSQHLGVLRDAGLIEGHPKGTKMIYSLNSSGIREMKRLFGEWIREMPNATPRE